MILDSILWVLFARPTLRPGDSLFLRLLRFFAANKVWLRPKAAPCISWLRECFLGGLGVFARGKSCQLGQVSISLSCAVVTVGFDSAAVFVCLVYFVVKRIFSWRLCVFARGKLC